MQYELKETLKVLLTILAGNLIAITIFWGIYTYFQSEPVNTGFKVVELDKCEYIVWQADGMAAMAHKGNCKNPIHQYNVVVEDE